MLHVRHLEQTSHRGFDPQTLGRRGEQRVTLPEKAEGVVGISEFSF